MLRLVLRYSLLFHSLSGKDSFGFIQKFLSYGQINKTKCFIQIILVPFIVCATCLLESCLQRFIGSRMKVFMLAFKMNLVNNLSCENVVTCVKSYKDFFFHFDELYACSIFVES